VTAASGASAAVAPSEQVVVTGLDASAVESYAAPDLDAWDRWNYARSERQVDPVSARYVASGVYGVDDLDHYGDWRVVPSYGALWVPRSVAAGWVPYSSGRWIYDPYYGWTWVDDAPWGWAPYHYGRWVHVSGYWGWCPGPRVARPYYAPALVAFYGGSGFSVGFGGPRVAWVPLGWGEPLVPWWGSTSFRRYPRWAGWGGPRVVNQVIVTHNHVIQVNQIKTHENVHVRGAVVAVDRDHFGRHAGHAKHFVHGDASDLAPLHGEPPVKPDRTSLVAGRGPAERPPHSAFARRVVATRAPRPDPVPSFAAAGDESSERVSQRGHGHETPAAPPPRIVEPPREGKRIKVSTRPPFGHEGDSVREIPPPAPSFGEVERKSVRTPERARVQQEPARVRSAPEPSRAQAEPVRAPDPLQVDRASRKSAGGRRANTTPAPGALPGEPANRVYPDSHGGDSPGGNSHGGGWNRHGR
jgi:hypothetical protein